LASNLHNQAAGLASHLVVRQGIHSEQSSNGEQQMWSDEQQQPVTENTPKGKIGWAVLWLLGVPLPVLIVLYFLTGGGCSN
jgi:hypothetical protein